MFFRCLLVGRVGCFLWMGQLHWLQGSRLFHGSWFLFLTTLCLGERAPAGRFAEQVAEHAVPQFGFEPRAFWRQDAALVGDGYQVGDAEGMQGKGDAVWGFVR